MLIVFTGDGKGKTTAALGAALRAVGDGKKVLMVQFIKGPWRSGEDESHKKLLPNFKIVKKGLGFVGIGGDKLPFKRHVKAAQEALAYARVEAMRGKWDAVILDEINNAVHLNLIKESAVIGFLHDVQKKVEHVMFTGRACPAAFIERAELVTEMHEVKHPFDHGIKGKKGLEY